MLFLDGTAFLLLTRGCVSVYVLSVSCRLTMQVEYNEDSGFEDRLCPGRGVQTPSPLRVSEGFPLPLESGYR